MTKLTRVLYLVLCAFALSACTSADVEEGDRDLVLRVGQLEPYGLSLPEGFESHERFRKEQWIDGSMVIDYEFEAPANLQLPYVSSMAELHSTNADACASYSMGNFGFSIGTSDADVSIRDDFYEFGDESRFAFMMLDGEPIGMYFGMCSGRTAFMLVMGGFYFEDSELFAELVEPVLDRLVSMQ